ncbi:MAG: LAGLIDADG family homing endonuclease, partial [Candidatus Diapherotrites archaeon]
LSKYDLIFCTNEKIDSLTRHGAEWLQNVGLLITDEIHELDSDRGATLEMVIAKMRHLLPELQVLALSATIPNAKELAEWLDANLVESDFRPVELKEGILLDKTIYFQKDEKELDSREEEALDALIEDTLAKGKQAMFFLNTRRNAENFAKKASQIVWKRLLPREKEFLKGVAEKAENVLESPTEQCRSLAKLLAEGVAFHHAGLLGKQRDIVEDFFREGKIKILCATTTLAAGINTPAFRVVIPSLYRYTEYGMQRIPVREYKQMCLPFDSKIITREYGEMEIGELVEKELECSVLSFNEKKAKVEFKPIVGYFENPACDLVELRTVLGAALRLTPEHPLPVREKSGFDWKESKNVKKGDLVVHQKVVPTVFQPLPYFIDLLPDKGVYVRNCGKLIIAAREKLGIAEKELSKMAGYNYKISYHYKTHRKAMPFWLVLKLCEILEYSKEEIVKTIGEVKTAYGETLIIPERVTADFLWLAGLVATDGNLNRCIDKRTKSEYITLRIFNTDKRLINRAKSVLLKFGIVPYEHINENSLISLEAGNSLLCKILKAHLGIPYGNKTCSVQTPEFLLKSAPGAIGAYLGGVFDGDGNYNEAKQRYDSKVRRFLIATSSGKFASELQHLFLKLGILAKVSLKENNYTAIIRNKKVRFSKPVYLVVFRKIEYLQKIQKYAKITKCKIDAKYSNYNGLADFYNKNKSFELVKIIGKKRVNYGKAVYNLTVKDNNNYFADNILVHNCGRAGRPKFDSSGESVIFARSDTELDELKEGYVEGEIERVESKLSYEPVLRMHLLALIASRFVVDEKSMGKFFKRTFYSHQFGDIEGLMEKLSSIADELMDYGFVEEKKGMLFATPLGKRVSDLYLDPVSARKLIEALKKKLGIFAALYALTDTSEFLPAFLAQKKREADLWQQLYSMQESMPINVSSEQFQDTRLLDKFNSALLLQEWVEEKSEQQLMDDFGTKPGTLFSKLKICDWLAYSAIELSKLVDARENLPVFLEARKRLKYGVKKELLELVELRGIGRVRGRRLYRSGMRSLPDLKRAPFSDVARVLGDAVAASVKGQLGQKVEGTTVNLKKEKKAGQSLLDSFS